MSKTSRSKNPSKKSHEVKKGNERAPDKEFLKLQREVIENDALLFDIEDYDDYDYLCLLELELERNKRSGVCEDDAESIVAPSLERVLNESYKEEGSPLGRKLWGDESKGEANMTWSELMEKMKKTL